MSPTFGIRFMLMWLNFNYYGFKYFFCSSLLILVFFHYTCATFSKVSHSPWIFCSILLFFFCLCSLCFSALKVSVEISSSSEVLPQLCRVWISLSNAFFILLQDAWSLIWSFGSFLSLHLSAYKAYLFLPVYLSIKNTWHSNDSCLNSCSYNSNIPAMSFSDASIISSNCVFCLVIFSLIVGCATPGKRTAVNRFSVMWW